MNCVNAGSQAQSPHEPDEPGYPALFLDLEPEAVEPVAAGFTLAGFSDGCYNV